VRRCDFGCREGLSDQILKPITRHMRWYRSISGRFLPKKTP
jgi:hypothetical protein